MVCGCDENVAKFGEVERSWDYGRPGKKIRKRRKGDLHEYVELKKCERI